MRVHANAAGFTLVELLVVLALLAGLATVAMRSVGNVQERARLEATQHQLQNVRDAILGVNRGANAFEPGLLADLGRLPVAGAPGFHLIDLWRKPVGVAASTLVADAVDPGVVMAVGWRGPYLQLPPGVDRLFDGFGVELQIGSTASEWYVEASSVPGLQPMRDVLIDLPAGVQLTTAEVSGTVVVAGDPGIGEDWTATVFVYEPNPTTGGLAARREDADTEVITVGTGSYPVTFQYRFKESTPGVANTTTPGRRILRAYVHAVSVNPGEPRPSAVATPLHRLSPVTPTLLVAGAQTLPSLVIP